MKTILASFAFLLFLFPTVYSQDLEKRGIIQTCARSMNEFWAENDIERNITFTDSSRIVEIEKGSDEFVLRNIDIDTVWTIQFTVDSKDTVYLIFDNKETLRHGFRLINENNNWKVVKHIMTIPCPNPPGDGDYQRYNRLLESTEGKRRK